MNEKVDTVMQGATEYKEHEIAFFKAIVRRAFVDESRVLTGQVEEVIVAPNEIYSITAMHALKQASADGVTKAIKKAEAEQAQSAAGIKGKSRWKIVDEDAPASGRFDPTQVPALEQSAVAPDYDDGLDGEPMSDIDGVPMEDSDLEGDELDGQPLDMDVDMPDSQEKKEQPDQASESTSKPEETTPVGRARKPRPKAEDMFADSDDDNN